MGYKRKGSCIYKFKEKCTLTEKWCKLLKEDFYLCDKFIEYEGEDDVEYLENYGVYNIEDLIKKTEN